MRPVYKTAFQIGSKSQLPSLDEIIEVSKKWVSRKIQKPMKEFEKGFSLETPQGSIQTTRIKQDSNEFFGMKLNHPDSRDPKFEWELSLGVKSPENSPHTTGLTLSNAWKDGRVCPNKREVLPPEIVKNFIETFPCYEGYKLDTTPIEVDSSEVPLLVQTIFDNERTLPLVCISCKNYNNQ